MIPKAIQQEIKDVVFEKADAHDYINRTRPENRKFMHDLIQDPEVGERLGAFMEGSQIKTYIKDAILNQYSKTKFSPPDDIDALLKDALKKKYTEIERDKTGKVTLHVNAAGDVLIVACGTYIKWESALRKALEFGARFKKGKSHYEIVLVLSTQIKHVTDPDMRLIRKCLERIGVRCIFLKI